LEVHLPHHPKVARVLGTRRHDESKVPSGKVRQTVDVTSAIGRKLPVNLTFFFLIERPLLVKAVIRLRLQLRMSVLLNTAYQYCSKVVNVCSRWAGFDKIPNLRKKTVAVVLIE
jgi:hypothetical protein